MANNPKHPLSVKECGIHIPMDILASGGRIRRENGEDVGPEEVIEGETCVLDLRGLDSEESTWFAQISSRVKDRLGLDTSREVIPITPDVAYTIGGVPCDDFGRVIFEGFTQEGLPAKLWFTGLFAAGRSANTGMHGNAPLAGNLLLEELVTGKAAGSHASVWASQEELGGASLFETAVTGASNKISSLSASGGIPVGQFSSELKSAISSSSQKSALESVRGMKESGIRLTDESKVMNTEMVDAIRLDGLASLAEAILAGE
jgi:succinate dehydrogenase/fumarate reductase flavoprotein subunit